MGAAFGSRRLFWPAFFALLGFVLPLLMFTNLDLVQNSCISMQCRVPDSRLGFGRGQRFRSGPAWPRLSGPGDPGS